MREGSEWEILDPWWTAFSNQTTPNGISVRNSVLDRGRFASVWPELDDWWAVYTETGNETAIAIRDLLEVSNERWASGRGPFDTDPLAADVAIERSLLGPLQPADELQWSYWLSELLREPIFATHVFEREFADEGIDVVREDSYDRKETDGLRRADIVLRQGGVGVSIEVKLFDTHFQKTAETAALVEGAAQHVEWSHTLVLPKSQRGSLVADVDVPLETSDDGHEYLPWDDPGPVRVVYWSDVVIEARRLLREGLVANDQWNAAAYLFCGLVEQQLLNFQPLPVVRRMATASQVMDTIRPIKLGSTLDEQLTHLEQTVDT